MPTTRRMLIAGTGASFLTGQAQAGTPADDGAVHLTLAHADGRETRYRLMTPSVGGRWPVVLFSHGANSSSTAYDRLWSVWAARGYAVIGPDHIDTGPPAQQAKPPAAGLSASRVADVSLPLRKQTPFDAAAGARRGTLDWSAVVAAGHSYGAVIAQGLAGATLTDAVAHGPLQARESAVRACLAFSPPGPRPDFVPPDAWSSVRVPSLLQTGDIDVLPGFVDDWRSRLTGFGGAPDRWTLVGHGVDHYFGGLICRLKPDAGAAGPALDETAALSATFLDAYVRRDGRALARLKARAARGDDGVAVFSAA